MLRTRFAQAAAVTTFALAALAPVAASQLTAAHTAHTTATTVWETAPVSKSTTVWE